MASTSVFFALSIGIPPRFQLLLQFRIGRSFRVRTDMRDLQSGILNSRVEIDDLGTRRELHFVQQRLQSDLHVLLFAG